MAYLKKWMSILAISIGNLLCIPCAFASSQATSEPLSFISTHLSQKEFMVQNTLRPRSVVNPFLGSSVDIDEILPPNMSYTQPEQGYKPPLKNSYTIQAGVSYKLLKSVSLGFDPKTMKFNTELGFLNMSKNKRVKLRVNRKRVKAVFTYKW